MIHKTALISRKADIGPDVEIGPYSIIGDRVTIGKGTKIGSHVVIEGPTTIGEGCRIFQFCSLGEQPQDLKYGGEPTELIVGRNCTFREYVTLNRGTVNGTGKTVLGDSVYLMAYSHVAHDCRIEDNVIMANGANLAGHIHIEKHAIIGGLVGIHQFVRIGCYAMVGGLSAVAKDVVPYVLVSGVRAVVHGLNLIGLKRHGLASEAIDELKTAYRIFFRSGLTAQKALGQIVQARLTAPEVGHFVDFIKTSERGVIRE